MTGNRYSDVLVDLANKLIDIDQRTRLGCFGVGEIKAHPFFKGLNWDQLKKRELKPPFIPKVKFPDSRLIITTLKSSNWNRKI